MSDQPDYAYERGYSHPLPQDDEQDAVSLAYDAGYKAGQREVQPTPQQDEGGEVESLGIIELEAEPTWERRAINGSTMGVEFVHVQGSPRHYHVSLYKLAPRLTPQGAESEDVDLPPNPVEREHPDSAKE